MLLPPAGRTALRTSSFLLSAASRNCVIRETDLPRPARPFSRTNQPTINHPLVSSFVPSILSTRPPAPESDNRRPTIPSFLTQSRREAEAQRLVSTKEQKGHVGGSSPFLLQPNVPSAVMGRSRPTRHGAVHPLQGKEKKRCVSSLLLHALFVLLCFLSPLRVSATPRELLPPQALRASASLRLCVRPIGVPLASLCPACLLSKKLFSVVFKLLWVVFPMPPPSPRNAGGAPGISWQNVKAGAVGPAQPSRHRGRGHLPGRGGRRWKVV